MVTKATDTFIELAAYYLGLVGISSLIFHFAEGRGLVDSVWWSFVTSMTVGYGDIFPVTLIGRLDAIVLMHVVPLFIVPLVVVRLMEKTLDQRDQFSHEEQEQIKSDLYEIKQALKIH